MNDDLLKAQIKAQISGKCYLLCGEEEYTKTHYTKLMLNRAEQGPLPEFNLICFNEKTLSSFELASAMAELPYMSDYKLIYISDVDLAKLSAGIVSDLIAELRNIPEYVNVLFSARGDELSQKIIAKKEKAPVSELISFIEQEGLVVEFEAQSGYKLKKWLKRHFDAATTPINDDALEAMIGICGEDMYTLNGEAKKLIAYCNGRTVTKADVENVCCSNKSFRIFDLTKALTARNISGIHEIYNLLIKDGASPFMVLNMLSSCITDMTVVKSGLEAGKSVTEIAKTLKSFDWIIRNYVPYVKRVSYEYLEYATSKCNECALALKSFRTDPANAIEVFLLKLAAYDENEKN